MYKKKFLPKKNLAPSRCTHNGNQKLVGMQAIPIMIVCKNTLLSIGSPQKSSSRILKQ